MPTLRQLAVETLTHMAEGGQQRVAVDDEARGILRQWMLDAKRGVAPASTPQPAPAPAAPAASSEPEMSVEEKLDYLRRRAADWKPARKLGTLRETMVFAVGNPRARIMLVGEAPGYEEDRQGEPFVGPAGQLLTKILGAMGLQRSDVYISNVCKFRPSMGENQGTANRAPSPEELAACKPLIMAEIRAIAPACIVCLGGSSAKGLLGVQRNEALSARRALWEDMLAVMEHLQMPITEKQRGYFR